MYYPYFRGKQYELVAIRDMVRTMQASGFCPIIEPVNETLNALKKTLDVLVSEGCSAIVIVNPHHGDLRGEGEALTGLLEQGLLYPEMISAGILLTQATSLGEVSELYEAHSRHSPVFVHAGFLEAKALTEQVPPGGSQRHVFLEQFCGKLYRKRFAMANRVLLRDGFVRKRNRDYDFVESFSDLHVTYSEEGMNGFGDFLIVGEDYSEAGGPAYAVAIHLTFIDPDQDDVMRIYHFVSDRQDTPQDPAGKFAEALDKMIDTLNGPNSKVFETAAVKEFRRLHEQGHFPGLGYVKKLSMNHHIETLARYFEKA